MAITLHGTDGIDSPDFNATGSVVPANGMYLPSANTLAWTTNSTRNMTLDASGNLGIGTSSPSEHLEIYGTSNQRLKITSTSAAASASITLSSNSKLAYVYNNDGALNVYNGDSSGALIFSTNATERARIDSSGNLLVGKTSASATTVGFQAEPNGGVATCRSSSSNSDSVWYTYSTGAAAARFYVGMGGTVYATSATISAISDQRFKENIVELDVGLDAILSLKPRKFDWKEGKGKDIKNDRGFIAQEFEQVFPDLIDQWADPAPEGEEPYKAVRPDLIPVIVKAIQELTQRLEALEAK